MGFLFSGWKRHQIKEEWVSEGGMDTMLNRSFQAWSQFTLCNKWIMVFTDWVRGLGERANSWKLFQLIYPLKRYTWKLRCLSLSSGDGLLSSISGTFNLSRLSLSILVLSKFKISTWNRYVFAQINDLNPWQNHNNNEHDTVHTASHK